MSRPKKLTFVLKRLDGRFALLVKIGNTTIEAPRTDTEGEALALALHYMKVYNQFNTNIKVEL